MDSIPQAIDQLHEVQDQINQAAILVGALRVGVFFPAEDINAKLDEVINSLYWLQKELPNESDN